MERDQGLVCPQEPWIYFNSHAHVERDMVLVLSISFDRVFQLTRSRGAWREDFDFTLNKLNFNSHAHVERDDARPTIWQLTRNFNSHAHVERDRVINSSNSIYLISTHTLTWSVTCNSRICITYHAFQLTRSRGAWLRSDFYKDDIFDFNSHAHVERDQA